MTTVSEDLAALAESTHRLMDTLEAMRPEQVAEPSQLPGWTRGHVIAHLARNADALSNLLIGARLGERRAMYPSPRRASGTSRRARSGRWTSNWTTCGRRAGASWSR
ncbi:maleylpyruvate isomerase N-terminal domain-containing protein [Streptacidiphilus monticola]